MAYKVGDIIRFERTFTKEDVAVFTDVSKDEGRHHREVDELDRLVVQGLLTATLPTKIGGDLNVLARTMVFEFLRPVFTKDTIVCEVTIEKYEGVKDNRIAIETSFTCINQEDKQVLKGSFAGVILQDEV
ncbi:MAG TPA: enoyl-CoA hydratase [Pseudogracilibacillus sp.]|nr:enoyl-CoA hydratase [Pseudogracilibacillus sp.]